jgi:hypothetical protein
VGALLQAIEHDPLNNLLNVPVQIANKMGFQAKKYALFVICFKRHASVVILAANLNVIRLSSLCV